MKTPKVFISYSHDSDEHKQWVLKLHTKLSENDIEVMFDQSDLHPGSNSPVFMEKLRSADRVLLICTDNYVQKANDREGGVGYEANIITAELYRNLKTTKFIPVVRQSSSEEKVPIFLEGYFYIDFTENKEFDENLKQLVCEIHKPLINPEPKMEKKSPPSETNVSKNQPSDISQKVESASDAYKTAEKFIREDDKFGWQQFVKQIRRDTADSLQEWRPKLEQQMPEDKEQLFKIVDKTVDVVSPLISTSLIGVESGEEKFNNQKSVIHDLFTIVEWKDSSYNVWIDMPNVLVYVFHSLHGGLSVKIDQLSLALDLVQEKVRLNYPEYRGKVWEMYQLTGSGYTGRRGIKSEDHWNHLANAYENWEWLSLMFVNDLEYRASLIAYYMALNIHELATAIKSGDQEDLDKYRLKMRLDFLSEIYEIKERAIDILLRNSKLSELWECIGVKQEQMETLWKTWIDLCKQHFWRDYQGRYYKNDGIHRDHENFFDNL